MTAQTNDKPRSDSPAGRGPSGFVLVLLLGGLLIASASASVLVDLPTAARDFVLWQMRIPRVLIGFVVGATLGLVGAAFQTLFQNPLATPSTLGTTAGATLGAMAALTLGLSGQGMLTAATVFAFVGALGASALILPLTAGRVRLNEVLLAGIAVSLGASALSQALHVLVTERQLFAVAQWSLGQLPQVGFERVWLAMGPGLACAAGLLVLRRPLTMMLLGEDWAQSMGVSTHAMRTQVIVLGCLGVSSVVALCGPIAFVGLLVPHLVRPLIRRRTSWLFACSWICGGTFLILADFLARTLVPGREIPVGALTAALGAPALLVIVLRRRKET